MHITPRCDCGHIPQMKSVAERTWAKGPEGTATTDFSRTFENGKAITGGATITKAEGKVMVDVTRVGPNGKTWTGSKTFEARNHAQPVPEPVTTPVVPDPVAEVMSRATDILA